LWEFDIFPTLAHIGYSNLASPLDWHYTAAMADVTQLLAAIQQGQPQAAEELLPLVYDELRKLARLKLHWDSCGQFFTAAAEAMRRILAEALRLSAICQRCLNSCPVFRANCNETNRGRGRSLGLR